jgi:NAD-dependent deacetylase
MVMALPLDPSSYLLVLTGAGISAESGVPTFRDANGLWEGHSIEDVASPEGFARDPLNVWRFYSERRANLAGIVPNAGHRALVDVEQRLGDRFLLVTQNVDGLHTAAGSQRVVELHGNLMRSRCTLCERWPFEDGTVYRTGVAPMCGRCRAKGLNAILRPDIVWFGEPIPRPAMKRIEAFVDAAGSRLRFLAVGTSGQVYPAAALVDVVRGRGGRTWLVNAEAPANADRFDEIAIGPAGTTLPALFAS